MNSQYPVLNLDYHLHYYGNSGYIYKLTNPGISKIDLDEVSTDILELCNGINNIEDIYINISKEYNLDFHDEEARGVLLTFIDKFTNSNILTLKNNPSIYNTNCSGERRKLYPYFLSLELTNLCNFKCTHCYKETLYKEGKFLEFEKVCSILDFFRFKTPIINITGGEPLLHPYINDILSYSNSDFKITLLTNGSRLDEVKNENLKKLYMSQVSMYGNSNSSYEKNTGYSRGFSTFCSGIQKLKRNNVYTAVALTINKYNMNELNSYCDILLNLGVDEVRFGLALPLGRLLKDKQNRNWTLNQEEINSIKLNIDELQTNHKGKLKIKSWKKDNLIYNTSNKNSHELNCMAGKTNIVISEEGKVRPCNMLPAKLFNIDNYEKYFDNVVNGVEYSFKESMMNFEDYLHRNNLQLSDIKCKGCS